MRLTWLRERDSNPRPPGYGPGELPTALSRDDCFDDPGELLPPVAGLYPAMGCVSRCLRMIGGIKQKVNCWVVNEVNNT
jgi:hypothetical protein